MARKRRKKAKGKKMKGKMHPPFGKKFKKK